MPEGFEGDLTAAVFWGADLRGPRFRDVNLTDVTISHSWLVDVEIDAFIDRVVVNGVDVTAFVNEHDPWYPLRSVLRVSDPESMRAGWAALREAWAATLGRAQRLPVEDMHGSVDGEWSFVQTLRHLVFAMDKWFTAPILGQRLHTFGLPDSGSIDFPWPDLDREAAPSMSEVLAARPIRQCASATTSQPSPPTTSPDPSTCSRTAPTSHVTASPPCSRKSSGTTDMPSATWPNSRPAGDQLTAVETVMLAWAIPAVAAGAS